MVLWEVSKGSYPWVLRIPKIACKTDLFAILMGELKFSLYLKTRVKIQMSLIHPWSLHWSMSVQWYGTTLWLIWCDGPYNKLAFSLNGERTILKGFFSHISSTGLISVANTLSSRSNTNKVPGTSTATMPVLFSKVVRSWNHPLKVCFPLITVHILLWCAQQFPEPWHVRVVHAN